MGGGSTNYGERVMDLDNFVLPDGAAEAIRRQGFAPHRLADGVSQFSGHDQGVAFRFFIESEKSEVKSKAGGYSVFNEIEMIEWTKDRFMHPTERLRFLPAGLIEFAEQLPDESWDTRSPCIGGKLKDSYERFKTGRSAPGLSLAKWGILSDGEIATLASMGVFSVEQFASMPRGKIAGKLPQVFVDALEQATQYMNGKDMREVAAKQTDRIVELEREREADRQAMAEMREQMKSLLSLKPKATRNRKAKVVQKEAA